MNNPTVSLSIELFFRELGGLKRYRTDDTEMNMFEFKPWGSSDILFEDESLTKVAKKVAKHLMIVAAQLGGVKRTFKETNLIFKLTRFNPDINGRSVRSPLPANSVLDDEPRLNAATFVFTTLVNEFLVVEMAKVA